MDIDVDVDMQTHTVTTPMRGRVPAAKRVQGIKVTQRAHVAQRTGAGGGASPRQAQADRHQGPPKNARVFVF